MIQMIVQYEVKQNLLSQYRETIDKISTMLPDFEADMFSWSQSEERNIFVETFYVPTEAHYHALKKMRLSRNHSVFGILEDFVPGGLERIGFMAIKQKR
ncbi:hypothetical protein G3A_11765 [Bacillus sp. 17376]|uniref:ABM domain-containing protein n=1 Tax=Mesobacillus boroniphilus JCM 21738 TaxID=1294265 RepID=W4RS55_9BACI|nr:hypothetical protein [Mesobacillus boroniphilus]ESU32387.1 hypothetical protein G3A_11765 [Bacillus sp. 17376]GAE46454.1 hypothetical protein JCM21738_3357 [Mesobacillus boroniphilus JCM 21738]